MNEIRIKRLTIIVVLFTSIVVVFYFVNFNTSIKCGFSQHPADWGSFGSYITGVLSPILSGLNIYLFYVLTKTASEFNKKSIEKQLSYNTCKEYQNKINDLVFEFLSILEKNNIKSSPQNILSATSCLKRLIFFIDSFIIETEPFIGSNKETIVKTSSEKFKKSINDLIESNYVNTDIMKQFFDNKSAFIKLIFDLIINSNGTR